MAYHFDHWSIYDQYGTEISQYLIDAPQTQESNPLTVRVNQNLGFDAYYDPSLGNIIVRLSNFDPYIYINIYVGESDFAQVQADENGYAEAFFPYLFATSKDYLIRIKWGTCPDVDACPGGSATATVKVTRDRTTPVAMTKIQQIMLENYFWVIPVALVAGVSIGWAVFGRKKRKKT